MDFAVCDVKTEVLCIIQMNVSLELLHDEIFCLGFHMLVGSSWNMQIAMWMWQTPSFNIFPRPNYENEKHQLYCKKWCIIGSFA